MSMHVAALYWSSLDYILLRFRIVLTDWVRQQ